MHLQRRWSQLGDSLLVDLQRGRNELLAHAGDVALVVLELRLEDGVEDPAHVVVVELHEAEHEEVPDHPRGDEGPAAAGWAHGREEVQIDDRSEGVRRVFPLVPAPAFRQAIATRGISQENM